VVHEYSCRNCEKNGISVPIIKAPAPTPLIKGSIASASLASEILAAKYVLALPLYRQEEELKRLGINIPRQNLANWVIKVSKDYLSKLYGILHDELMLRDICHIDETTVEVLHEPGRDAEQKSYMWIYGTGKHDSKRIVLFDYQQGRSGEHPKTFMVGFKGFMHTDGYSGYNKMIDADRSPPDIIRVGCWAHARRKYDEALKSLPKEERQAAVLTNEGLDYCNELFKLEKDWKDLSPEDRLQKRKRFASPIVDAYFAWVEKMSRIARGQLAKAVNYSLKQESVLRNYLLDGRLEISNNLAERAVRPFVIGRNNWLFANTPAGAESSAIVYSIVETAKANGLIPRSYMEHLLTMMPDMDLSNRSSLMQLLPWSETLPDSIRVSVTV
jgi:hypothetical protein